MAARIIDGQAFARQIRSNVSSSVTALLNENGIRPGLAAVLVGEDPASHIYVRNKRRMAADVGFHSVAHELPADTSEAELLALIDALNRDNSIHGILVQLPLPRQIDSRKVIDAILPEKDVDGFSIANVGRLGTGQKTLTPCTPLGCLILLRAELGSLVGRKALVVGASNIVGKPMAQLLLAENCTVTIAHVETRDLEAEVRQAEILVVAAGSPGLIRGDWIKPGAIVIDVGINRIERGNRSILVGDVDFDSAMESAAAITPVPGGVGPMTIACLLVNTLTACIQAHGVPRPNWLTA